MLHLSGTILVSCTFLSKENAEEELHACPVLLPHEVLACLAQRDATIIELWRATPTHTALFNHAHAWCSKFEVDHMNFLQLGVHGDGVPFVA